MARKKRRSSTWRMLEAVQNADRSECPNFPPEFLCGLRGALEAGLSCEEITAFIVLLTGIREASEKMSGDELLRRAEYLAYVMKGDIDILTLKRELARERKELRKLRKKKEREV